MKNRKSFSARLRKWYIIICLYTIFPAFCLTLFSSLYAMDYGDHWDARTTATVISCEDITDYHNRGEGFPSLTFKTTAQYTVNGKTYEITETGGCTYDIGSTEIISYRSDDPADSYWAEDPAAQNRLMKRLHTITGCVFLVTVIGFALWLKDRHRKKEDAKAS